jgi:AraC-like DNA-binding protein
MSFNLNPKSVTLLFMVVHGLLFSVIHLYHSVRDRRKSSGLLSLILFLGALYIFPFATGYGGWYGNESTRTFLFYFPFHHLLLIAPAVYFYFKSLLGEHFVLDLKVAAHFFPGVLYLLYSVSMFAHDFWIDSTFSFYADGRDRDFDSWYQLAGFVVLCVYAVESFRLYLRYVENIKNTLSYADEVMFKWARNFLVIYLLLIALRLTFFITNPEWNNFGQKFWYYACFGGVMYYLALNGFANTIRVQSALKFQSLSEQSNLPDESIGVLITAQEAGVVKDKIIQILISKHSYTNPRLTVADLAQEVGVAPKRLSQIINQSFEMNFNDLINLYRVKEVLSSIDRGESKTRTLLALAEDAGFNSKTTFNRVFKKFVNQSPKDYAKALPNPDLERTNQR